MLKKLFLITFFSILTERYLFADFFSVCGIKENELRNIEYVLKNSSNRFIPREIDDIKNETFKRALYLLSFYKEGAAFPEEFIDIVGVKDVKKIRRFKEYVINYILKKNENNKTFVIDKLYDMNLETSDFLFILKNKYFNQDFYGEQTINNYLNIVFFDKLLSIDDIKFLIKKYRNAVDDKMLLQQVRLRLWNKKTEDNSRLRMFIRDVKYKEIALKIQEFNEIFNKITSRTVKLKNGTTRRSFSKLSKEQKNAICKKWNGYDEYVDLCCIENNKRDIKYIRKILKNNLNSSFLPGKWLTYRLYFIREIINANEKITDEDYEMLVNGGRLANDEYYTQQFFAGFISFLRKDYSSAVLHFSKCTEIAKFAEYASKAYYWLGLSYRRLSDKTKSDVAFNEGKKHIFTMYGQLSASELEEETEKKIKEYISSFNQKSDILCDDINFVLGYLEQKRRQDKGLSEILLNYIDENVDKMKLFNALSVIKDDFGRKVAKTFGFYALRFDVAYDKITFPTVSHENDSLVKAVIKKESNFTPLTIGGAGERGLMQIMPSTGRVLARMMGIKYDHTKLLVSDKYNVDMGKFYLDNLLYRFDNNKLLALASYNAGGGNVEKWIARNGDPRDMTTNEEIVTWIEKIPFSFTRGYVVHILGAEMVYDVLQEIKLNAEQEQKTEK